MTWGGNNGFNYYPKAEGEAEEDETFEKAHATVMILAWIVFASTAILYARYGRTIRLASREKLLGEAIWFQVHRFVAMLTTMLTLLGFFFILVQAKGGWVEPDEGRKFVHSVLGGIIVCCALIQAWMALFRCHPDGAFRFIYNWLHRLTGLLAFFLSIPTIFLVSVRTSESGTGMTVIMSIWSGWVVLLVIVMEIIQILIKKSSSATMNKSTERELDDMNIQSGPNGRRDRSNVFSPWNNVVLVLFVFHFIVSIALAIPLIVLAWK